MCIRIIPYVDSLINALITILLTLIGNNLVYYIHHGSAHEVTKDSRHLLVKAGAGCSTKHLFLFYIQLDERGAVGIDADGRRYGG